MNEHYEIVLDLVRRMRQAQRDYFATRSRASLNTSMRLEQEVDRALEQPGAPVQGCLLPDEEWPRPLPDLMTEGKAP